MEGIETLGDAVQTLEDLLDSQRHDAAASVRTPLR
jgi:hypothetical protein